MSHQTISPLIHPSAIEELPAIDSIFGEIIALYGTPDINARPEGFESLCRIILEQQVSLMSAQATYTKLRLLVPEFTPEHIYTLTTDQMREATVSRQKATYIHGLASAIMQNELDIAHLSRLQIDRAYTALTALKGIGPWTAHVYLMFCLRAPDIFPRGDIALINTVVELKKIKKEEVCSYSITWRPHRSGAAILLWHYYLSKRGRHMTS